MMQKSRGGCWRETANVHDILVHVARLGEEIHHLGSGLFGVLPLVRRDAFLRELPVDVCKVWSCAGPFRNLPAASKNSDRAFTYWDLVGVPPFRMSFFIRSAASYLLSRPGRSLLYVR